VIFRWPDRRTTWEAVGNLGSEVEREYWLKKPSWPLEGETGDVEFAARRYLELGRAIAAINALHFVAKRVSPTLLFQLLDAAIPELNERSEPISSMFVHHVTQIFKALEARADVPRIDIARREYAYSGLFQQRDAPLTLHRMMADDPDFYMQIIEDVFRPKSVESSRDEADEAEKRRARNGYRLLSSFKLVPGADGQTLSPERLRNWIEKVCNRASLTDRVDISASYIGRILAHSPNDPDSGAWPHKAVAKIVDDLQAEEIERGIMIERFNMRGVFSKGHYEGGSQERDLAAQYRAWAKANASWSRMASILERIAVNWDHQAEEADLRARQDKMRD
jgi:hypothetical protein